MKKSKLTDKRLAELGEVIARIAFIWFKHPQLRLCQLVGNCFSAGDNYGRPDEELLERLKKCYPMSKDEEGDINELVKELVEK